MVHPHLISAIINEPWAISGEAVIGLSHVLSNIFNPAMEFEAGKPDLPSVLAVVSPSAASPAPAGVGGGGSGTKQVEVISITGPLMKNDQFCGPAGMKTLGNWIQNADNNPAIDGIMLLIDSPGGTVSGTEELGAIIKGTSKPIVAFVEDMACSAAYWLASCCDEIIANNTTAQVGSIGVLMSFMDVQPALEKEGVKFHTITAPQSSEKLTRLSKVKAGEYADYKENVLKPVAAKFIDIVKANRPAVDAKQLTGDVYFASDATGTLIDAIATYQQALQRVAELSGTNQATFNPPTHTMSKPELKRLAKAAGVPDFESSDGSITLTAEVAQAVETALEAHETAQATMQQQIETATNQQSRVEELEGQLQTANARIAELSNAPGADPAAVHVDNDSDANSLQGGFWNRFHNLSSLNKSK